MHQSSFDNMKYCFEKYIKVDNSLQKLVVDVGGRNVNKKGGVNYSSIFPNTNFLYKTLDVVNEPGVDIFCKDPYKFPVADSSVDIVISGQTLEHAEFFWLTFNEMVRICKKGGFIFCIVPMAGKVHRFPTDCWRFYPDAYQALAKWGEVELLESFQHDNYWRDNVGIFIK